MLFEASMSEPETQQMFLWATKIEFLGHTISKTDVQPDEGQIRAILNFHVFRTMRVVKSFLGLASYYRRYVLDFAMIASPLIDLTEEDKPSVWDKAQQNSFADLKTILCSATAFRPRTSGGHPQMLVVWA